MSSEEQFALGLSIVAIVGMVTIPIIQLLLKGHTIKKDRKALLDEAEYLCEDLKRILTDYNDDDEERYEVDLSLTSYFKDNNLKLKSLADRLTEPQVWWYSKNPDLNKIGELLYWLIREFYDDTSDEEERIRVWSRNVSRFHSKYLRSFHKKSIETLPTQ